MALKSDVEVLARHYFDDEFAKPGDVGEAAFKTALDAIKTPGKRRK